MTLKETISQMTEENQLKIAFDFLNCTLPIWVNFTRNNEMSYTEHVIGTHQVISKSLIQDVIQVSPKFSQNYIESLAREILETITAIQDDDWQIDEIPKLIIYSAYNLLEHCSNNSIDNSAESHIYISINQSIDVITQKNILTSDQIKMKLKNAL